MKNILFLAIICILIGSCAGDTENTMTVTGNVKGLKKGTLYLQKVKNDQLLTIDSLIVDGNGNFEFKTELESPEVFYLYLNKKDHNDVNDRITFFGEPGTISITTSWDTFDTKAVIEGSPSNKKLEEYKKNMSRFNTMDLELVRASLNPKIRQDSIALDSLAQLGDRNILRGYLYSLNFALNNKDSYVAPYIALTEVSDANVKYLDSIHNSLSPEVADSKYGKELKDYIAEVKKTAQ
ncbi:MAG: DUF4369 domain-containing protein [Sediminicola sp.]